MLAAAVGHRHAAAAALDGKRKGVKGILAALLRAPPVSHSEATDRPSQLSYPTPAPGPRDAARGAVDRASRAWLVSMPCCRVGSRADAARKPPRRRTRGTAFSGALRTLRLTRRRRPPLYCARRCARARAGGTAPGCHPRLPANLSLSAAGGAPAGDGDRWSPDSRECGRGGGVHSRPGA